MRHPAPEQSPVPDAEPAREELYRTIPIREGLSFDIVIDAYRIELLERS